VPNLIELSDLALSHRAARFEGKDHGAQVSFFVTTHERGERAEPHRHPYEEVFVVQEGEAMFTVDGEALQAHSGQILVVPAGATHSFESSGDALLRQVSIHPAPAIETDWLRSTEADT